MVLKIVQIGNSWGIRLPKKLLEQFGFNKEVKIDIKKDGLFIRNVDSSRENWDELIRAEINKNDYPELLLSENIANEFDKSEWEW